VSTVLVKVAAGSPVVVLQARASKATAGIAATGGYVFDKPMALDTGTVLLVRSRPTLCLFGASASLYAKLRVLGVDSTARRLDFEILVDQNCGYRGLEPGLPKQ
jgi:hypothetical protein